MKDDLMTLREKLRLGIGGLFYAVVNIALILFVACFVARCVWKVMR